MKRITTIFALLIMMCVGAWATDLTLTPSNGTYVTSSGNYVNSITFSTTPAITVTATANNMDKRQTTDYLLWHSGSSGSSTYTIAVSGYYITAYSVTGEANTSAQTLTAGSNSHEFTVGTSSTFSVTGLGASSVQFTQTGANASGLKITSISVTVEPIITSVSEFKNNKAYYVTTADRGAWFVTNGGTAITSTTKAGFAPSMSDTKQQFAFLTYGTTGVYHLYSITERKFVSKSGQYTTLTSELGDNVTLLTGTGNANYPFVVALQDGAYQMGISNGYDPAVITFWNSLSDGGNQVQIREVADFDPTAAMAILEAAYSTTITVTYEVYDGATLVESLNVVQDKNSAVSIPAALLKNTWYYDYTASGTIGETDCTITVQRTYKQGVVTALSSLSNNKAYRLVTERGTFTTDNGALANTSKSGTNYTVYDFAIVNYESAYYLWSVQDGKFVAGDDTKLTDTPAAITINVLDEPLFKFQCGSNYLNCNTNSGGFFSSWSTTDGGNKIVIIEDADFDPTTVLAALDAYFHPTNCYDRVESEILPYIVEDPSADYANWTFAASLDKPFGLKGTAAAQIFNNYNTQLQNKQFSQAEYEAAKAIFEAGLVYPTTGKFYLVKNNYNGKYLRVTDTGVRGTVKADLTAAEAANDFSAHFYITEDTDNKPFMTSQGEYLNWVWSGSGYEGFTSSAPDKYAHWVVVGPGVGAFSIALGNGEGTYAEYLNTGFYAVNDADVTIGSSNGSAYERAHWTFEEVDQNTFSVPITLNPIDDPNNYATLYVPGIDVQVTGADAFTIKVNGDDATPTKLDEGKIPAGTPALLVGASTSATAVCTMGGTFTTTNENDLVGTRHDLNVTSDDTNTGANAVRGDTDYFFGKDGTNPGFFHWQGTTLKANRAYLPASAVGNPAKGLTLGDFTTGINGISAEQQAEGQAIYNLQGQRVNKAQRGIYIVGGRKVIVK